MYSSYISNSSPPSQKYRNIEVAILVYDRVVEISALPLWEKSLKVRFPSMKLLSHSLFKRFASFFEHISSNLFSKILRNEPFYYPTTSDESSFFFVKV